MDLDISPWDDRALIKAYESAVKSYKEMHGLAKKVKTDGNIEDSLEAFDHRISDDQRHASSSRYEAGISEEKDVAKKQTVSSRSMHDGAADEMTSVLEQSFDSLVIENDGSQKASEPLPEKTAEIPEHNADSTAHEPQQQSYDWSDYYNYYHSYYPTMTSQYYPYSYSVPYPYYSYQYSHPPPADEKLQDQKPDSPQKPPEDASNTNQSSYPFPPPPPPHLQPPYIHPRHAHHDFHHHPHASLASAYPHPVHSFAFPCPSHASYSHPAAYVCPPLYAFPNSFTCIPCSPLHPPPHAHAHPSAHPHPYPSYPLHPHHHSYPSSGSHSPPFCPPHPYSLPFHPTWPHPFPQSQTEHHPDGHKKDHHSHSHSHSHHPRPYHWHHHDYNRHPPRYYKHRHDHVTPHGDENGTASSSEIMDRGNAPGVIDESRDFEGKGTGRGKEMKGKGEVKE